MAGDVEYRSEVVGDPQAPCKKPIQVRRELTPMAA
jgi:hypothetical protein